MAMERLGEKIKVCHFQNGEAGGVLSVLKNFLTYTDTSLFENHIIYTINKEKTRNFTAPSLINIATSTIFYYSPKWNFYYTCKKLLQLVPDEKTVIVANDWLELGMVSHIGASNPVLQILHGDYGYYYDLALKHRDAIDFFATVAARMAQNLREKLPSRVNDIYYLPFPVPDVAPKNLSPHDRSLQIIFVGRLTKDKGYNLLPLIENELMAKGVQVEWHIVGAVTANSQVCWKPGSKVKFHGQLPNETVVEMMKSMDCLVLPSLAEGMPVTVVEAMKVGLTCLVNDIPGGFQELIINDVTGYKVEKNEVALYAEVIMQLSSHRYSLEKIGKSAREKALEHFDPVKNTRGYEQQIAKYYHLKRETRKAKKVYGSRLDRRWIPNFITKTIRSF